MPFCVLGARLVRVWCVLGASLVRVCSMFVRFLWKPAAAAVILLQWDDFSISLHAILIVVDTGFIKWKQSGNKAATCFHFVSASLLKMEGSGNKAATKRIQILISRNELMSKTIP
jgi:hypothetical protein